MTMTMPSPRFLRLVLPRWIRFWGVSRSKRIIQKPISTPLRVLPQVLTHWIQVKHARQILNLRLHPLPALYAKKSQRDKLESSQEQNYIFGQLDWGDTLMSQVDFLGGLFLLCLFHLNVHHCTYVVYLHIFHDFKYMITLLKNICSMYRSLYAKLINVISWNN